METRAAVLVATGQPLRVVTLGVPDPAPGQVLVDVAFAGVCRSQLNEARGLKGPDPYLPHALGHEGAGTVAAVGAGVTKVSVGQRVVMTWLKGRGAQVPRAVYGGPEGPVNGGAVTTFMDRALVSENRLVASAGDMPFREAVLLGCAVPTGAGIIRNRAMLNPGESVAVFGVGGIGLAAVMGARLEGAGIIIAIDISADKLARARALGATHTVDATGDATGGTAAVGALTDGRGVDLAVEAAGRREAAEAAFESVRDGGGLCVLAGNPAPGARVAIDPFHLIKGRRLVGTWGGETDPDNDIPRYVAAFRAGRLPLERLITDEYPLDDINQALDDLEAGRVGRGVIRLKGRGG